MSKLVIKHDLSTLSPQELAKYLRDVSEFIGLDPDLNGLDTIWMQNENGPGQSLVVYARRGTAEILRNKLGIEVSSLTHIITPQGSIVFTATGKNKDGRQEIAVGSKFIQGLAGKALDDAIMTASTRALRRLTMQFTSLGILDESEVGAIKGSTENPASNAQLAGSPVVFPPPQAAPNNAPGKDITAAPSHSITKIPDAPDTRHAVALAPEVNQDEHLKRVYAEGAAALAAMPKPADIITDKTTTNTVVTPVVAPVTGMNVTDIKPDKPKRGRKPKNTVSMDVEPEIVNNAPQPAQVVTPPPQPAQVVPARPANEFPTGFPVHEVSSPKIIIPEPAQERIQTTPVPPQAFAAVPPQANPASTDFPGKPTDAQMTDYRKRVSVYTSELPSSEGMGSVQKMRAFITKMSGAAPQFMTVDQWEEMLSWFEGFVNKNTTKGLIKYINDSLGVK